MLHRVKEIEPRLFQQDGEFYLIQREREVYREYRENSGQNTIKLYVDMLKVYRVKKLSVPSRPSEPWQIDSLEERPVYGGRMIYVCSKPGVARQILLAYGDGGLGNDFEGSVWWFSDIKTPNKIMQKIINRIEHNDKGAPIITIKLKRTPFAGFKKDVLYKRYSKYHWTLTNRNGREAGKYDLLHK